MPLSNASRLADFGTGIGTAGAIIQVDNANQRLGVGTTAPTATLGVAGIVSATAFYGDGSNLDGVASAGLGTALSEEEFNPLTVIYQTSDTLSVGATITVDPPDATTKVAYTQYAEILLQDDADLIVADGDDFIPDILGLSTEGFSFSNANGNGIFDTVYTDNIENAAGRGGPNFPLGITVSGISTLSGNVSIGGTLTYEDVTNVDSVGVVTARSGIDITSGGLDITAGGVTVTAGGIDITSGGANIVGVSTLNGNLNITGPDANNYITLKNTTASDTSGTRSSKIIFQGTRSGGEVSDLVHLAGQHDGGNDNDWGAFRVLVNNGSGVTERFGIGQGGEVRINASIGAAGQVLTSAGGGSPAVWATPSGGAWEFLSSVSNPNTSTVDFVGLTTAYAAYKVHFINASINTNNVREMRCRIYLNGSLKTGNEYQQLTTYMSVGSNSQGGYGQTYDSIMLSGNGNGARGYNGELTFPMKLRTTGAVDSLQAFYGTCISHDFHNTIGGFHNGSYSTLLTGIQFDSPDNYNVTDGQFYLYGLKRS